MSRRTHRCAGCGVELRSKDDMEKQQGTVYASWRCRQCATEVPGVIAEQLKHQT